MRKPPSLKQIVVAVFFLLVLAGPFTVQAAAVGDSATFNVEPTFEKDSKSQTQAVLAMISPNLYFYVAKDWWNAQSQDRQTQVLKNLNALSVEFDTNIYPTLTSVFGQEWKPGVDGDNKITILFHEMKDNVGGYFRSVDEYLKLQNSTSNEREMLYLPLSQVDSSYKLKVFLAHEFTHLIEFNQKDRLNGTQDDVWLNELRAEYGVTLVGYNDPYQASNLQSRVKDFLEKPSDSVTEWQESKYDYASINVFAQYLVDHYGVNILSDSLKLKSTGMASLNEILVKNGYQETVSQIFVDWTLATLLNDCTLDLKYCYLNSNFKNFRINPTLNFLPLSGSSSLTVSNVTKNWAGNWQKIIGGSGDLTLDFSSLPGLNFQVPYIIVQKDGQYSVNLLKLDAKEKGRITIKDFGQDYNSLIILPSLQTKMAGFDGPELTYPYTFTISITQPAPVEDQAVIEKLLAQIASLKVQISALLNQQSGSCGQITVNLSVGSTNRDAVTCLQSFLKSQGASIYPEGLVTGTFGSFTKAAVIRFQETYKDEILTPAGLTRGNGYVGPLTREKINKILMGSL